jgi:hypothetical protein
MDPELILNPATNRFVKRSSQTGKRLIKQLSMPSEPTPEPTPNVKPYVHEPTFEPVQTALLQAGAEIVAENTPKFKHLSPDDTDALFKRLLLERLSIAPARKPKKKSKYRVVSSESESSD